MLTRCSQRLGLREMILVVGNDSGIKKNQSLPNEISLRGDARRRSQFASFVLGRTGGFSGGPVPDPISNSAVKLPSADGTKS